MTYTVMAHDPDTQQVGIEIATASIAGGALCPLYTLDGDIVCSQAYARPEIGLAAARMVAKGKSLQILTGELELLDPQIEYRQLAILRRCGEIFVHTGSRCCPWAGHCMERNCLVMGNALTGEKTINAMMDRFVASVGASLAERLVRCLEAGRDAGEPVR